MPTRRQRWPVVVGAALVAFGMLAILSVGLPFLVAGVVLLVDAATGVRRRHPKVFWPVVAAIAGFFAGFVGVAPWWCTSEAVATDAGPAVGATTCSSLTGIHYAGGTAYEPPLWPGVLAGGVMAAVASGLSRWLMATVRGRCGTVVRSATARF